ncbi:hypothetical protein [Candidatus Soleaferrea massiliensis]|uniref:hypothetical protein n=1 Tax=Candidatus Soleaferrea massiliensis TaxID=1470354 RepID=UPI0012E01018|nr:hypothetical protein [Candidatus Soleaferrea massiliensis]
MNKGKRHLFKKCGALLLAALMASSSMPVFAGNSYVTDNTEEVMNNASSEGGC